MPVPPWIFRMVCKSILTMITKVRTPVVVGMDMSTPPFVPIIYRPIGSFAPLNIGPRINIWNSVSPGSEIVPLSIIPWHKIVPPVLISEIVVLQPITPHRLTWPSKLIIRYPYTWSLVCKQVFPTSPAGQDTPLVPITRPDPLGPPCSRRHRPELKGISNASTVCHRSMFQKWIDCFLGS